MTDHPSARSPLLRGIGAVAADGGDPQLPVTAAPPSPTQAALWLAAQLASPAAAPVVSALRLDGRIDPDRLDDAVSRLIARHGALRTTLPTDASGRPVQLVAPSWRSPLARVRSAGDLAAEIRLEVARAFELAVGPLFRARLFVVGPYSQVLTFVASRAVCDRKSLEILHAELFRLLGGDEGLQLPPAQQFAELAVDLASARSAALERPAAAADAWAATVPTAPETFACLVDLANDACCSLEDVLGAALGVLVGRWLDERDASTATAVRPSCVEGVVGPIATYSVLARRYEVRASMRELLAETQRLPSDDVLFAPADASLVEVQAPLELEGPDFKLSALPVRVPLVETAVRLDVLISPDRAGATATLAARRDIVDEGVFLRVARSLGRLLDAVAADPGVEVGAIGLGAPGEAKRLLAFARRDHAPEAGTLLHTLVEDQAVRTPEAVAVIAGGVTLTYVELNERANRLARALVGLGVGEEAIVVLCLERSADLVAAVLAVLKAGGAYLSLVSELPAERLAFIVADAKPAVIISNSQNRHRIPPGFGGAVLLLEEHEALIARQAADDLPPRAHSDNLAFVAYTSGSTGRPKGVMVTHRVLVSRLKADSYEPLVPGERYLLTTAPSFFDSNWETFTPLMSGGAVVVPRDQEARDAWRLVELAADHGVRRLVLVPSLLAVVLELPDDVVQRLASVRWCLCSGEQLPQELLARARNRLPNLRVANVYGLSETWDVCWEEATAIGDARVIGRPLSNSALYVLDSSFELAPHGAVGELFVGGEALARGYLRRPGETAGRFVPNPFGPPGSRLYRTGDRVRWREDGRLEFHGRADRQVKIRGFRIELDEVEAALRDQLDVDTTVVIDSSREPRLVAYLVAQGDARPGADVLRNRLAPHLPDYMIPSAIVWVEALPLTSNGKLDRNALPAPAEATSVRYRPPQTEIERLLARSWELALGASSLGVDDDVCALGANTLAAAEVRARLRFATGIDVPLAEIVAARTVRDLAAAVEDRLVN